MKKFSISNLIATGFGSGYLPVAPGTWGSLVAVIMVGAVHWFLPARETQFLWIALVAATATGIFCANQVVRREGSHDPSKIVIDEIAGQFLTLLFVPVSLLSLVIGFFLFRIFDMVKPFPARNSERLPDGWGIMADDLIAGVYAGIVLYAIDYAA